jgi:hypothetical protein
LIFFLPKSYLPYTLAGFDLTTHSSSLIGGRRRRYHFTTAAAAMSIFEFYFSKKTNYWTNKGIAITQLCRMFEYWQRNQIVPTNYFCSIYILL